MKTEWNEGYEKGYADALAWDKKEAALQRLSDFTQEAEKTLTDEEIQEIWFSFKGSFKDFAKAILRKASEK
jgi:hypothetical protein